MHWFLLLYDSRLDYEYLLEGVRLLDYVGWRKKESCIDVESGWSWEP